MSSDEQILSKTNTTMTGPENGFIAPLESSHANSAQGVMHTIHEGHAAIAQGVTHNFHEGHAEPEYEYINKYSISFDNNNLIYACLISSLLNKF